MTLTQHSTFATMERHVLARAQQAIGAVLLMLPAPFVALWLDRSLIGFAIGVLTPAIVGVTAGYSLWQTRNEKWLMRRSSPHILVRVPLASLPLVLFITVFNSPLILTLLLEGTSPKH